MSGEKAGGQCYIVTRHRLTPKRNHVPFVPIINPLPVCTVRKSAEYNDADDDEPIFFVH